LALASLVFALTLPAYVIYLIAITVPMPQAFMLYALLALVLLATAWLVWRQR
jgi:hypothetical protein